MPILADTTDQLTSAAQVSDSMLHWQYRHWLQTLKDHGGNFLTARQIVQGTGIRPDRCNILMRHDIDKAGLIEHVWPLLQVEMALDVRSSTYLFAHDPKNIKPSQPKGLFRRRHPVFTCQNEMLIWQDRGFEFGYHTHILDRCPRLGDSIDPRQAQKLVRQDIQWLQAQGLKITTMAAHGFGYSDGNASKYNNYAAEWDYSIENPNTVYSQFDLIEAFVTHGGTCLSKKLPEEERRQLSSIWAPKLNDFSSWFKPVHDASSLKAEALTLTDAGGVWKYMGIRELAAWLPKLTGCLVILNTHPIFFGIGKDGVEFKPHQAQFNDHAVIADDIDVDSVSIPSTDRCDHHLDAVRYKGPTDFDTIHPNHISENFSTPEIQSVNAAIQKCNKSVKGLVWFEHLINSPNEIIIRFIDDFWPKADRDKSRFIEICGGIGPVAVGLTFHGFKPENMVISDKNKAFLTCAQTLNEKRFEGKMRVQPVNILDIRLNETFDIATVAGWEMPSLPYDQSVAQCAKILSPDGILVMTFLEKTRVESEGLDFAPERSRPHYAITADELAEIYRANSLAPVCYLDGGYPVNHFPRHILVGQKL